METYAEFFVKRSKGKMKWKKLTKYNLFLQMGLYIFYYEEFCKEFDCFMFSGFLSNLKMKVCTFLGLLGDMSTEEKLHLYAILPFQVSSFENASKTQFDIKMSSSSVL